MLDKITISVDPEMSLCTGRNGTTIIKELSVWKTCNGNQTFIDPITRKGRILNGGIIINTEAMTELAKAWLKQQQD